jgi:hypothetical protein
MFWRKAMNTDFPYIRSHHAESPAQWGDVASVIGRNHTLTNQTSSGHIQATIINFKDPSGPALGYMERWDDSWSLIVCGHSPEALDRWVEGFSILLPPYQFSNDGTLSAKFWSFHPMAGGISYRRDITVNTWGDIHGNYPAGVTAQLDALMATDDPGTGGKVALFHGPPGTGKTQSILALIKEWAPWCEANVITDADKFFGDANYMNAVLFNGIDEFDFGDDSHRDWRLLIIEDGDDFINVGQKDSKGQSIARLLNLGDGLIGQGLNIMTLLSTNVEVHDLNPALARKGRCMANIHFPAFDAGSASQWAEERGVVIPEGHDDFTLAGLYDLLR